MAVAAARISALSAGRMVVLAARSARRAVPRLQADAGGVCRRNAHRRLRRPRGLARADAAAERIGKRLALLELVRPRDGRRSRRNGDRRRDDPLRAPLAPRRPRTHRGRRDVGGRRARGGARPARCGSRERRRDSLGPRLRGGPVGLHGHRRHAARTGNRRRGDRGSRAQRSPPSYVPLLAIHGESDTVVASVQCDGARPTVPALQRPPIACPRAVRFRAARARRRASRYSPATG